MSKQFYNQYKDYSQSKLFEIVLNAGDYQSEAVQVAQQLIHEKDWTNELNQRIEAIKERNLEEEVSVRQDIIEKAAYYRNLVEFKKDNNSFQVRISDIPKFEAALNEKGIEFFREDKHIGVQLDAYPTQTYFFRNEDFELVDQISKEINLVAAPYADIKPFFKFELIVILIVIALCLLFIFFFE